MTRTADFLNITAAKPEPEPTRAPAAPEHRPEGPDAPPRSRPQWTRRPGGGWRRTDYTLRIVL